MIWLNDNKTLLTILTYAQGFQKIKRNVSRVLIHLQDQYLALSSSTKRDWLHVIWRIQRPKVKTKSSWIPQQLWWQRSLAPSAMRIFNSCLPRHTTRNSQSFNKLWACFKTTLCINCLRKMNKIELNYKMKGILVFWNLICLYLLYEFKIKKKIWSKI